MEKLENSGVEARRRKHHVLGRLGVVAAPPRRALLRRRGCLQGPVVATFGDRIPFFANDVLSKRTATKAKAELDDVRERHERRAAALADLQVARMEAESLEKARAGGRRARGSAGGANGGRVAGEGMRAPQPRQAVARARESLEKELTNGRAPPVPSCLAWSSSSNPAVAAPVSPELQAAMAELLARAEREERGADARLREKRKAPWPCRHHLDLPPPSLAGGRWVKDGAGGDLILPTRAHARCSQPGPVETDLNLVEERADRAEEQGTPKPYIKRALNLLVACQIQYVDDR